MDFQLLQVFDVSFKFQNPPAFTSAFNVLYYNHFHTCWTNFENRSMCLRSLASFYCKCSMYPNHFRFSVVQVTWHPWKHKISISHVIFTKNINFHLFILELSSTSSFGCKKSRDTCKNIKNEIFMSFLPKIPNFIFLFCSYQVLPVFMTSLITWHSVYHPLHPLHLIYKYPDANCSFNIHAVLFNAFYHLWNLLQ